MIHKVELFNVAETEKTPYGYRLSRYPASVKPYLTNFGGFVSGYGDACEIRFVKEGYRHVRVMLMAENTDGVVTVMRGDRTEKVMNLKAGVITAVNLERTNSEQFADEMFEGDLYDRYLVRLVLTGACFVLCDITCMGGEIRPPKKEELPKSTFVAYGSSITQGAGAYLKQLSYISQTARLLERQVLDKGLGGSCLTEKEVADYITDLSYEFLVFEIGTNMYFLCYDNVYERGKYLIEQHFAKHPDTYLFLIEPLLTCEKFKHPEKYKAYMETVRKLHKDINNEKCILIPADYVMDKNSYLSTDGIHPTTEGHMMMGINVANVIKKYV